MLSERVGDILNSREAMAIGVVFSNASLAGSEQLLRFTFPTYVMEVQLATNGAITVSEHDCQSDTTKSEQHPNVMAFLKAYTRDD